MRLSLCFGSELTPKRSKPTLRLRAVARYYSGPNSGHCSPTSSGRNMRPGGSQYVLVVALVLLSTVPVARAAEDLFAVAARHYEQGRWRDACQAFDRLLTEQPRHARASDARFFYGEALAQLSRLGEAREQFLILVR